MKRKPDLLVLVAIWQFLTAFAAFIGVLAIIIFAIPAATGRWGWDMWGGAWSGYPGGQFPVAGAIFGLSIAIFVLVCYMAVGIIGGIGLLVSKEWGRIVSIVHEALSLMCVPVGTVIGALSIVYLTRTDVRDYFIPPKPQAPSG
jgi:hypothetical protein